MRRAGLHFLHIPGPSRVPDRILRAMDFPVIDHRGPAFADLGREVLAGIQSIFKTRGPVVIYPSSGTGAWEAALVNTLSPGDKVVMVETGHFAAMWQRLADRLGLDAEVIPTDWRRGVDPAVVEDRLRADTAGAIKALCVVHNETSTGATSRIGEVREAIDAAGHPALLLVDTISGLACADYRHEDWGVDVSVSGSQKGLMLPPGLSFNAISDRAMEASKKATLPGPYWAWEDMIDINSKGYFPYTPATNLLYGLKEAIAATGKPPAGRWRLGAWKRSASRKRTSRRCSPGSASRTATTPTAFAPAYSKNSICRWATACRKSQARCSASGTWGISTTCP